MDIRRDSYLPPVDVKEVVKAFVFDCCVAVITSEVDFVGGGDGWSLCCDCSPLSFQCLVFIPLTYQN